MLTNTPQTGVSALEITTGETPKIGLQTIYGKTVEYGYDQREDEAPERVNFTATEPEDDNAQILTGHLDQETLSVIYSNLQDSDARLVKEINKQCKLIMGITG